MEKVKAGQLSRRMDARRTPSEPQRYWDPGELDRATIITTIRRMGYILVKAHEVIMGKLIAQDEHELAERVNDTLKPLADLLLHFELDDKSHSAGGEDGEP